MAFQRLLAFGGDAWTISQQLLENPEHKFSFEGRTGTISVKDGKIDRQPIVINNRKMKFKF
jgi:outer membrane PBP1 activator LpoA protein